MKLQKKMLLVFSLLLCSCAIPLSPPPPPPLPGNKSTSESLTLTELAALDQMNQLSRWMMSLGKMATTHSNQPVVINYGNAILHDYQKQEDTIRILVKTHSVELTKTLPVQKQKQLSVLSKLYGKKFDRIFLGEINKNSSYTFDGFKKSYKNQISSKDIVSFMKDFLELLKKYKSQAQDILRYE